MGKVIHENKETIIDGVSLVIGIFLYAICFNLLLNPNDLVVSGFSGLAIIMERLLGWNPSVFLYATNIVLLTICFFMLGVETTKRNILGSLLYPLMLIISKPITDVIASTFIIEDFYLIILIAIILYGVSSGLIYRSGYTTGGSDIIMQIINKYMNISESKSMVFANVLIIIAGMFVFGVTNGIYSFIILAASTYFVDKLYGISDSKLFYIYTRKNRKITKLILEEFETGFTSIPSKGGYSHKKGILTMCVVANHDYYILKKRILEIDPDAFIVTTECYEVSGGKKRSNLPFL